MKEQSTERLIESRPSWEDLEAFARPIPRADTRGRRPNARSAPSRPGAARRASPRSATRWSRTGTAWSRSTTSLAFAETLFGRPLPLPIGLLFHVAYLTFWSVVYVGLFRDRLTFLNALWLALALWGVLLMVFFPIIGWGFLGLAISPKIIVASLVPHLLFAVVLWGLCRVAFAGTH